MRRESHAFQQLQTFIARELFIAFQHFYLRQRQVLNNGEVRKQLKVLEHHADVGTQLSKVGFPVIDFGAIDEDLTLLYRSRPLTVLISVDLPEPDGPHTTTTSPFFTSVEQSVST